MFWALVMTVWVGGQPTEYVIDQARTAGACMAMLQKTANKPLYRVPIGASRHKDIARVDFACERTRVVRR